VKGWPKGWLRNMSPPCIRECHTNREMNFVKKRFDRGARKKIVVLVCAVAFTFLASGAVLGLWSGREMIKVVIEQFNEEQLVIARHVSALIEREVDSVKNELLFLRRELNSIPSGDPARGYEKIKLGFSRVVESGVCEIDIVDVQSKRAYKYIPYNPRHIEETTDTIRDDLLPIIDGARKDVWIYHARHNPPGPAFMFATSLHKDFSRILLFKVDMTRFLLPFLKDIRSGKTGYVWIIDGEGIFLFHPVASFVGKSAFVARKEKDPDISYERINFIQKERMLKGEAGTGWYFSGWHRGVTGKIKKLIAYHPIILSRDPLEKWSVAVVAPMSEIEGLVHEVYVRHLLLQGFVILVIVLAASALIFFEMRWSGLLEGRVEERTEELRKSEERYRSLVESAEDFIFTVNAEGVVQSMNSFTANFFGGQTNEFIGKDLSCVFPEEVAEKQINLIRMVYRHGKSARDEFEVKMGEQQIWLNGNFMPLRDDEGEVNGVLCIARDITENKKLERQLINAEKLASLGTLAAGVAHEINNPLGVILGFCDLLLKKAEKGTQEFEDLKTIERQGLHCKDVVENLLSFARLEKEEFEYCHVNLCLAEVIKVVKHTLEMKNIELILELDEHIPLVKGDPRQMQQVFLNLVNNAVSAMEHGGTLVIRTRLERRGKRAIVQFQDNGTGIKEEDLDHIFEPFFTTKPEGEGTGLGLFVSYGIVAKYGGSMDCVSHVPDFPGKPGGTTFTVTLITKREE